MVVRGGSAAPLGSGGARELGGENGSPHAWGPGSGAVDAGAESEHDPNALLRLATDALPVQVAYADADERDRMTNDTCRGWLGPSPAETVGHALRDVLGDAADGAILSDVRRALAHERVTYQGSVDDRNGGWRQTRAGRAPDVAATGEIRGVVSLLDDPSDRAQAVERAARLASASRDLTNPPTVIKGRAQRAGFHAGRSASRSSGRIASRSSDRIVEAMATIQAVAEAMGGQVDEVRDVSLLRMGQTPTLDLDPVDLVALADGEAAPWRHQDPRHVIVDDADRGGAVATGVPRVAGPG